MKALSLKVGVVLLSIWLLVFMIGHLESFGVNWINFFENLPAYCYPDQQSIVDVSKNVVTVRFESVYEEKSTIEIGARFGPHRLFSKSKDIPIILLVFIGVWGSAIIFILGLIVYRIGIEPMVKKESKDRTKSSKRK